MAPAAKPKTKQKMRAVTTRTTKCSRSVGTSTWLRGRSVGDVRRLGSTYPPPLRTNQRETKPAQIFDRTRIYDRIDARRDLSLGEVHWGHSPRWIAQGLCEMQSTQTQ